MSGRRRSALGAAVFGAMWVFSAGALARADDGPRRISVGDPMPRLEGDLLSGKAAALPDAARGQVAVAALGFTYDSRFAVEAWETWFKQAFGGRPGVTFYQVPMMGRAARFGRLFIDRGMRRNTPKEAHDHVMTVYSDTGPWKTRAGFAETREKDAYLFLLGPDGVVRWQYSGPFDERQAASLKTAIDELMTGR